MNEVDIKFEKENIEGAVAVGSYLIDAAKRIGVDVGCDRLGLTDACAMMVKEGGGLLTEPTKAEHEVLGEERLRGGERLACQTKITAPGSMLVRTMEQEVPEKSIEEQFLRKFEEMPLEEKTAILLKLETMAFGETFGFVVNSPYKIADKIMDVMAQFGLKLDKETKDAVTPDEHAEKTAEETEETTAENTEEAAPDKDEVVEAEYDGGGEDSAETEQEKTEKASAAEEGK